jgi:ferrochelatase
MRYGLPSIGGALRKLREDDCQKLIIVPLYPQYSSSTTASTVDAVAKELRGWRFVPEQHWLATYYDDPGYIAALAATVRRHWQTHGEAERLLFSYHGIPLRFEHQGDPYRSHCLRTTELVARSLQLNPARFAVTFQSRFGNEPWLTPYTDQTLLAWARSGVHSVDVICPGFSADCLETLEEIDMQNREIFLANGGQQFRYIAALNEQAEHVHAIAGLIGKRLDGLALPA